MRKKEGGFFYYMTITAKCRREDGYIFLSNFKKSETASKDSAKGWDNM